MMSPKWKTILLGASCGTDVSSSFPSPTPNNHVYLDGINFKTIHQQGKALYRK